MRGKPYICSVTVLVVAGLALADIWRPDLFLNVYENILEIGDWIMSVVVVVVALALLLCCWWPAFRQKKKISCENECTHPASPYPELGWKCITGFRFKTDLCLARLKERDPRFRPEQQYIVAKNYIVCVELDGKEKLSLKVPRGLLTDLASVPRPFRPFVGRVGPHLEASIIHDYLYIAWQIRGLPPTDDMRLFSDKVMLAAMLASGMGCKAHAIYWAIRFFGTCVFYGRNPEPWTLEDEKMPQCCCRKSTESEKEEAGET